MTSTAKKPPTTTRKRKKSTKAVENAQVEEQKTKKKPGRVNGAKTYSVPSLKVLNTIVEKVLPLGRNMWNTVCEQYNQKTKESRDWDSLKTRWMKMVNDKKPTGDPDCPEHIKKAKILYHLITESSDAGQLGVEEEEEEEEEVHDTAEEKTVALTVSSHASAPTTPTSSESDVSTENAAATPTGEVANVSVSSTSTVQSGIPSSSASSSTGGRAKLMQANQSNPVAKSRRRMDSAIDRLATSMESKNSSRSESLVIRMLLQQQQQAARSSKP